MGFMLSMSTFCAQSQNGCKSTYRQAPIDSILIFFNFYHENNKQAVESQYPITNSINRINFKEFDKNYIDTLIVLLHDESECYFTMDQRVSVFREKKGKFHLSTKQVEVAGLIESLKKGYFPFSDCSCSLDIKPKGNKAILNDNYRNELIKWLEFKRTN